MSVQKSQKGAVKLLSSLLSSAASFPFHIVPVGRSHQDAMLQRVSQVPTTRWSEMTCINSGQLGLEQGEDRVCLLLVFQRSNLCFCINGWRLPQWRKHVRSVAALAVELSQPRSESFVRSISWLSSHFVWRLYLYINSYTLVSKFGKTVPKHRIQSADEYRGFNLSGKLITHKLCSFMMRQCGFLFFFVI